ncbi:MAG: histidine kinase [Ferruginibacter sp.]
MSISLPKYTGKDYMVLALVLLPITLLSNTAIFGTGYFGALPVFLWGTLITAAAFALFFTLCGGVAVQLKNRFSGEDQVSPRMAFMIFTFLVMSGLFLLLLFNLYASIPLFNYHFDENRFVWAYFILGICNIFLTFLHEGISRYESWKISQEETEQLRQTYRQSRLQGLKSQVNPHFLFNSLNSLSSLISEDEDAAEKFLDEMSKVYRYMLRNDDDKLVPLSTEIKFVESYAYLLKARYGNGLQVNINVSNTEQCLPPLSLQTIIENAITQNSISKTSPLVVSITNTDNRTLEISNSIQPKQITDAADDVEAYLDNLVNKYALLGEKVNITENGRQRIIQLSLLNRKKEEVAP